MADIRHLDINGTNKSISIMDSAVASALGDISGASIIQKFGRHDDVATVFEPMAIQGIYRMPKASAAVALRVKIGNAADIDTIGAGARKVTLQGLDETGALVTEEISTNGAASGVASTTTWMRLFRAYVSEAGTYGDYNVASQTADIIIETAAGVEWARLEKFTPGFCQTEIGCYTVPLGKKVVLLSYNLTLESGKTVDIACMKRESILDVAAPYQAFRLQFQGVGLKDVPFNYEPPGGLVFNELTDIVFFVKSAATAVISCDFTMLQMNA